MGTATALIALSTLIPPKRPPKTFRIAWTAMKGPLRPRAAPYAIASQVIFPYYTTTRGAKSAFPAPTRLPSALQIAPYARQVPTSRAKAVAVPVTAKPATTTPTPLPLVPAACPRACNAHRHTVSPTGRAR